MPDASVLIAERALGRRLRAALLAAVAEGPLGAAPDAADAPSVAELLARLTKAMRALDKKRSGWIDINPLRSLFASAEGGGLSAEDADALVVTLGRALNLSGALHTAEVVPRSRSSSDGGGAASPARETDKNRACFVLFVSPSSPLSSVSFFLLPHLRSPSLFLSSLSLLFLTTSDEPVERSTSDADATNGVVT